MATDRKIMAALTSEEGFYVGDVCYQMSDEDYDADWHKPDYSDFEGEHELRGHKFAIGGTAYGDGCYEDEHGHRYSVDSGTIGILPAELCQNKDRMNDLGKFVNAKNAWFESEDGAFKIRFDTGEEIKIDTGDEEEDDDWDDEY